MVAVVEARIKRKCLGDKDKDKDKQLSMGGNFRLEYRLGGHSENQTLSTVNVKQYTR